MEETKQLALTSALSKTPFVTPIFDLIAARFRGGYGQNL